MLFLRNNIKNSEGMDLGELYVKKGFTSPLFCSIILVLLVVLSITLATSAMAAPNNTKDVKLHLGNTRDVTTLNVKGILKPTDQVFYFGASTETVQFRIDPSKCSLHQIDEYVYLKVNDLQPSGAPGEPQLPMQTFVVKLPKNSDVLGVRVVNGQFVPIENELNIVPVPEPYVWTPEGRKGGEHIPNKEIYSLKTYFSGNAVTYDVGSDNDYKYVFIRVHPVQYIPSEGEAVLITTATINVYYTTPSESFFLPTRTTYSTDVFGGASGPYNEITLAPGGTSSALIGQDLKISNCTANRTLTIINETGTPTFTTEIDATGVAIFDTIWMNAGVYTMSDGIITDHTLMASSPILTLDLKIGTESITSTTVGTVVTLDVTTNLAAADVGTIEVKDPNGDVLGTDGAGADLTDIPILTIKGFALNTTGFKLGTYTIQIKTNASQAQGLEVNSNIKSLAIVSPEIGEGGEWISCVIITSPSLLAEATTLSDFHNITGINTTVVTTDEIWNSYSAAGDPPYDGYKDPALPGYYDITGYNYTLAKKIIAYLDDTNAHPNLEYVTILGNARLVPPSYYYYYSHYNTYNNWVPTDYFYTSPDYDLVPNYMVGRLPVNDTTEAQHVVQKIESWYGNATWDWFKNAAVAGGQPFSSPFFFGEMITTDSINRGYFSGMNVTKQFRTDGTFNKANLTNALSGNVGMIYQIGHGNGHSWHLEGDPLYTTDVMNLSTNTKVPIVVSIACMNGAFDTNLMDGGFPTSFGESTLLSDAGGISYIGGSRVNYGAPSLILDEGYVNITKEPYMAGMLTYVFKAYHSGGDTTGNLTTSAMNTYIVENDLSYSLNKFTLFEFVLLGDPALKIPVQQITPGYQQPYSVAQDPWDYDIGPGGQVPLYIVGQNVTINSTTDSPSVGIKLIDAFAWTNETLERTQKLTEDGTVSYTFTPEWESAYLVRTISEDGKEGWIYTVALSGYDIEVMTEADEYGSNQTVRISAIIWDRIDGLPVNGASVTFELHNYGTGNTTTFTNVTDENGVAHLLFTPENVGRYNVRANVSDAEYWTGFYVKNFTTKSSYYVASPNAALNMYYTLTVPRTHQPYNEPVTLKLLMDGATTVIPKVPVEGTINHTLVASNDANIYIDDQYVGYLHVSDCTGHLHPDYTGVYPNTIVDYLLATYSTSDNEPVSDEFTVEVVYWNGTQWNSTNITKQYPWIERSDYEPTYSQLEELKSALGESYTVLLDFNVTTDEHGIATFNVTVPSDAMYVDIHVYKGDESVTSAHIYVTYPTPPTPTPTPTPTLTPTPTPTPPSGGGGAAIPHLHIYVKEWPVLWNSPMTCVVRLYNGTEPMPDETVYLYTSFGDTQTVVTGVDGEAVATFTAPPFIEYGRIYGRCEYGEDSYHVHILPARLDVEALPVEETVLTNIDVKFYNADYTALLPDRPATVCMYRESGWRSTNDVFSEYVCPPIGEYDKNVVVPEYGSYRVAAGWRGWQSSDYVFMSPWSVTVSAESSYPANTTALIPVSVTDKIGVPVANATVMGVERVWIDGAYFNGIITARTDASGQAILEVPIPSTTSWTYGYMDIWILEWQRTRVSMELTLSDSVSCLNLSLHP